MNILYQTYTPMESGAFKYIESGYIKGLKKVGCKVFVWGYEEKIDICRVLEDFRPEIFIGYLRKPGEYNNFMWLDDEYFKHLNRYRRKYCMKVAMHVNPDVKKVFGNMELMFQPGDKSGAPLFYNQSPSPTLKEETLVNEKFIDIVLHPYSSELTNTGFDYWIKNNIFVLEEPLAADDDIYRPPYLQWRKQKDTIVYVGGWWPFKGLQLDKYLIPMKKKYGDILKIYGKGWPYLSEGYIADREFKKILSRSKINLVFHEPSQVQGKAIHVNERIFKLYALKAFPICDNNLCLKEYFDDDEIVMCKSPEEMIEKCDFYLKNEKERMNILDKGYKRVMENHTYKHRAKNLLDCINNLQV